MGRYRDTLAMREAGAAYIADFVDAGLPSTVVPSDVFEPALRLLCSKLAAAEADVVVAEAGASPLEPYNGEVALRLLAGKVRLIVLCASDPYAVVGVMSAFERRPDLVAGRATSTSAAIDLIEKLVSVPAINVFDPAPAAARSVPARAAGLKGRVAPVHLPRGRRARSSIGSTARRWICTREWSGSRMSVLSGSPRSCSDRGGGRATARGAGDRDEAAVRRGAIDRGLHRVLRDRGGSARGKRGP